MRYNLDSQNGSKAPYLINRSTKIWINQTYLCPVCAICFLDVHDWWKKVYQTPRFDLQIYFFPLPKNLSDE